MKEVDCARTIIAAAEGWKVLDYFWDGEGDEELWETTIIAWAIATTKDADGVYTPIAITVEGWRESCFADDPRSADIAYAYFAEGHGRDVICGDQTYQSVEEWKEEAREYKSGKLARQAEHGSPKLTS